MEEPVKETVLDVLMYLFESFVDSEDEPEPNRNELREELERAGFRDREIDRALDWLDGLNTSEQSPPVGPRPSAIRVYDRLELERLDAQARGYLLHLEQLGILPAAQRELVIDRLLALDTEEIDVEQIKWVVMMVLFSQPGQEQAYAKMEDLVFAEDPGWFH
jgi:Smg protein